MENSTDDVPNIVEDRELETLIIPTIKISKREKCSCGKDEVFKRTP